MTRNVRSAVPARPRPRPPSDRRPRAPWRTPLIASALAVLLSLAAVVTVAGPASSDSRSDPDASVVVEWDQIALRTVFTEGLQPPAIGALYLGIVQLAVYDAVVTVEGGYDPYLPQPHPRGRASSEVAAVTAAHGVLANLFPNSEDALDDDLEASLDKLPGGSRREHGIRVGEAAAAAMIAARADDGRTAEVTLDVQVKRGVWRKTPPDFLPMAMAQLGFVRPLVIASPTTVALPGPDHVRTAAYAVDYDEVKELGALEGSTRTPEQTATALFWNFNVVAQYHLVMAAQVTDRELDIVEGARAFAMLGTATGDVAIACWRAKYDQPFWRPVTAIPKADIDRNPRTKVDPDWTPLVTTPPYPEYPSGHACMTGAMSGVLAHLFGADSIDIDVPFPPDAAIPSRHFDTTAALDAETMDARILLGLHFRRAMTDGNGLGHAVADLVIPQFDPAS